MSWQETRNTARKELEEVLKEIVAINPEELARTKELGTKLDFAGGVSLFEQVIRSVKRLHDARLDNLPAGQLNQIQEACTRIRDHLREIQGFDPETHGSSRDNRDGYIYNLENAYSDDFVLLTSTVAAAGQEGEHIRQVEKQAEERLARIEQVAEAAQEKLNAAADTANAVVTEVQRAAASVGVAQHSVHFREEAGRHEESSASWLRATKWLAVTAFVLSLAGLAHALFLSEPFPSSIPGTVSKLAILAIAYYAVIWAGRMYRSERHNHVVNQHRHNSLRSFETFVAAAGDEGTKNAVLLHATESIFGHQPSSFSDKGQDTGSPRILEVIRGLTSGASE